MQRPPQAHARSGERQCGARLVGGPYLAVTNLPRRFLHVWGLLPGGGGGGGGRQRRGGGRGGGRRGGGHPSLDTLRCLQRSDTAANTFPHDSRRRSCELPKSGPWLEYWDLYSQILFSVYSIPTACPSNIWHRRLDRKQVQPDLPLKVFRIVEYLIDNFVKHMTA